MLEELKENPWSEVFKFAGNYPGFSGNEGSKPEKVCPGLDVDTTIFTRDHVKEIIAFDANIHNRDYICIGILHDKRYFIVRASCDSTGWWSREGGASEVADTEENLINFGLSNLERIKLGEQIKKYEQKVRDEENKKKEYEERLKKLGIKFPAGTTFPRDYSYQKMGDK